MRVIALMLALVVCGCGSQPPERKAVSPATAWAKLFSYVDASTPEGTRIEPFTDDDALKRPDGSVAVYVSYRLPSGQRETVRGVVSADGVLRIDE